MSAAAAAPTLKMNPTTAADIFCIGPAHELIATLNCNHPAAESLNLSEDLSFANRNI
jgi:hypothetical protein